MERQGGKKKARKGEKKEWQSRAVDSNYVIFQHRFEYKLINLVSIIVCIWVILCNSSILVSARYKKERKKENQLFCRLLSKISKKKTLFHPQTQNYYYVKTRKQQQLTADIQTPDRSC